MNAQVKPVEESALVRFERLPSTIPWNEKVAWLGVQLESIAADPCPVTHQFGHGLYIRHMHIPARTLFVGRAHLVGHECTLLSGSVLWLRPDGYKRMDAVKTVHTVPGFHMVVYCLTDVEAQTVHENPYNSEDIPTLEDAIFQSSEDMRAMGLSVQARLVYER